MPAPSEDQVIPYADPPNQTRRPFTSVMLTIWSVAAVAGLHFLYRVWVPEWRYGANIGKMELPSITKFVFDLSDLLRSGYPWTLFYAVAAFAPALFARLAWSSNLQPFEYRYRRLIAIHLVISIAMGVAVLTMFAVLSLLVVLGRPIR